MSERGNLLKRKNTIMFRLRNMEREALDIHSQTLNPQSSSIALQRLRDLTRQIESARKELESAQMALYRDCRNQ
ncbi:MAG: hypothetical protein Q8R29_01505 [bacterium]|nr:hypothetical protein [bacterium]